jgi:hypothetical protein
MNAETALAIRALMGHADRRRLDAKLRSNAGPARQRARAQIRAEAEAADRLADAISKGHWELVRA